MQDDRQISFFNNDQVRKNTDMITEKLDKQAIENIKALQEKKKYEEELLTSLYKINSHSVCPGDVPTCNNDFYGIPRVQEVIKKEESLKDEEEVKEVHGADCHCSKCCPNPTPNFFQKHKEALLIGFLWVAMIVLAVGWSPSGETFEAIQASYVDLIVNFFKMGVFAVAGIVTYSLVKKKDS